MMPRYLISIILIFTTFLTITQSNLSRFKRFTYMGFAHSSKNITYKITVYTTKLTIPQIDETIGYAFNAWTEATGIKFTQVNAQLPADITISFELRLHNHAPFDFDGPGGTLAHAFKDYIHFDNDEPWALDNNPHNANLYKVALHEIGHCLGLNHSDIQDAIMWPYIKYHGGYFLHQDDIQGVESIYKKQADNRLHLCEDPSFDTIVKAADGKEFIFKGIFYYDPYNMSSGAHLISTAWPSLPGNIDAGFTYKGQTYFFKEGLCWRYTNYVLDQGFPQPSPFIHYLDAAFSRDNTIFLFKNDMYYTINNFLLPDQVTNTGSISQEWSGVPANLNAAFALPNKYDMFYKGNQYYYYSPDKPTTGPYQITWDCRK